MPMQFEELDGATRDFMLSEFDAEQSSGNPYFSPLLTAAGIAAFVRLMREAIANGNEVSLTAALVPVEYWHTTETYERNGVVRTRNVNIRQADERLALTEFNTWYVHGLARRLLSEGVATCQAYRAAQPKWEPAECSAHEGQVFPVQEIYDGHRAKYHPAPGNPAAVSIPFGPGCHHTIRDIAVR